MKNSAQRNDQIMEVLAKFRLSCIGNGVMETTGDAIVYKVSLILADMIDNFGVTFDGKQFHGITGASLQDWQGKMITEKKALNTRNNYTILLNEFLKWGCGRSLFADPECDVPLWQVIRCGKAQRAVAEAKEGPKMLTEEQVAKLIKDMPGREAFHARDRAITAVFVGSGIRASALCGMNIGDYKNREHGRIRILNKGGAWKEAYLADFAYEFVDKYLETRPDKDDMNAPLFVSKTGQRFSRTTLNHLFTRRQKELGIPQGLHIFRHTFTSAAERAGGITAARDLAFHRSIATTNIYTHNTDADLRNAVNSLPWSNITA